MLSTMGGPNSRSGRRIRSIAPVHKASVRGDELDAEEVVASEAVLPGEETETASESQSGNTGSGNHSDGRCKPRSRRRLVEFVPCDAPADDGGAAYCVDPDLFHGRQVDDQAVITERVPRDVVAAAADGQWKSVIPCKGDRPGHVLRVPTSHNQCRSPVDHRVPDFPRIVVPFVLRSEEFPMQLVCELRKLSARYRHRSPSKIRTGMRRPA